MTSRDLVQTMSGAVESPALNVATQSSSSQPEASRCKICRCSDLVVHAHTAKRKECGTLFFWPYPELDWDKSNPEWETWRGERVLRWYSESSVYNHKNFTNMVLFAMGESHKGREIKVLDYGAGGGQFALVCKSLFPQAVVFTTDLSDESLLEEWKPLSKQIAFRSFARDPTTFDVIFLNDVLEHLSKPIDVLRQLKGKLARNGLIFVDTPKQFWLYPFTRHLSKTIYTKLLWATVHESHLQLWTRRSFMQVLDRSGFRTKKYLETSEFTMPPEYYLDNMGINQPALRFFGRMFYRSARRLANNKIFAVLEPVE